MTSSYAKIPKHGQMSMFWTPWPFQKRRILDSSKLKEFAKFDESVKKSSKWLENTEGITSNFSFYHNVFLKDLYCRHVKTKACLGKGYKYF